MHGSGSGAPLTFFSTALHSHILRESGGGAVGLVIFWDDNSLLECTAPPSSLTLRHDLRRRLRKRRRRRQVRKPDGRLHRRGHVRDRQPPRVRPLVHARRQVARQVAPPIPQLRVRTRSQERLHHLTRRTVRGHVERRRPLLVRRVHVHLARLEQHPHAVPVVRVRRNVQRRHTLRVRQRHQRTLLDQPVGDVVLRGGEREEQRRAPVLVAHVQVPELLPDQLHERQVACGRCVVQRGAVAAVGHGGGAAVLGEPVREVVDGATLHHGKRLLLPLGILLQAARAAADAEHLAALSVEHGVDLAHVGQLARQLCGWHGRVAAAVPAGRQLRRLRRLLDGGVGEVFVQF
eukprot:Rhum_TRINITY_DN7871_c0_g2::Rhum_TRINITY_DN7871_c0_g2_i1::g.24959::m.24959